VKTLATIVRAGKTKEHIRYILDSMKNQKTYTHTDKIIYNALLDKLLDK